MNLRKIENCPKAGFGKQKLDGILFFRHNDCRFRSPKFPGGNES